MAKKKRKNRSRKIRKQGNKRAREQKAVEVQPEPAIIDIRPDLRKTAILTAVCLGILFALFLTRSHWLTTGF